MDHSLSVTHLKPNDYTAFDFANEGSASATNWRFLLSILQRFFQLPLLVFQHHSGLPMAKHSSIAVDQDGTNQLILADLAGNVLRQITAYADGISFTVSPTNERLAYTVSDTNTGSPAVGELYVVDINTSRTRELISDPVVAFFWSPDGKKLAYQVVERTEGGIGLRWHVCMEWNRNH